MDQDERLFYPISRQILQPEILMISRIGLFISADELFNIRSVDELLPSRRNIWQLTFPYSRPPEPHRNAVFTDYFF